VCLDEMGPEAAKSFAGPQLIDATARPAPRARQAIDSGRRGNGYVFGAFQPARSGAGAAYTRTAPRRTPANFVAFLEQVDTWIAPAVERVYAIYAILDHLSAHRATDVLLFALLAHPRPTPGPPPLGGRLPAQIRRLPEFDRTVVEDPAPARAHGAPLCGLGGDLRGGRGGNGLLEHSSPPLPLGPQTPAATAPSARHRSTALSRINLADGPLSSGGRGDNTRKSFIAFRKPGRCPGPLPSLPALVASEGW
jgi:hypothetical protein